MSKRNPVPCIHKWRNASDDQPHSCAATSAPPEKPTAPAKPAPIVCASCGLPSRTAMIVKDLGGGRGRCVNTAACAKRQRNQAKVKT